MALTREGSIADEVLGVLREYPEFGDFIDEMNIDEKWELFEKLIKSVKEAERKHAKW